MNYTNREVVRRLKQYDMFLSSLKLTADSIKQERICDQLDKIEKQILLETNREYEEEYVNISSKEPKLLDDEKQRLEELIRLITERRKYLNNRKEKHKAVTGSLVELTTFLGEDKLAYYRKKLKVIEKYEENKVTKEKLIREMKTIDIKISESSRNVKANMRLNDMLEDKMISLVSKALDKYSLYKLVDEKETITNAYTSLSYAKDMALENYKSAESLKEEEMILDCERMLNEITKEYKEYDEKINIINLIEIYDKPANNYEELLKKREKIDDILKNITTMPIYNDINEELSKQYNTIKLEAQDIKTYDELRKEREQKNKELYAIDEENNSKEFKELLEDLVKNENKYRDEKIRQAKAEETKERERRLKEEQKIEASRVRRQKLIEEARLKEQSNTIEKIKELQDKTVINPQKEELFTRVKEELEKKEMPPTEEKIKNPLENKTLDEMLKYDDTFNTEELFENTKIVPNRVRNEEPSLYQKATESISSTNKIMDKEYPKVEEKSLFQEVSLPSRSKKETTNNIKMPDINNNIDNTKETNKKPDKITEVKEDNNFPSIDNINKQNSDKSSNSIYDLLEDNKNIIWKTTDTKKELNSIPTIENKNSIKNKEGEILWKETI